MDFEKFGNFNWIEMHSKDQNLDLDTNKINPFLSIFVCWFVSLFSCSFNYNYINVNLY